MSLASYLSTALTPFASLLNDICQSSSFLFSSTSKNMLPLRAGTKNDCGPIRLNGPAGLRKLRSMPTLPRFSVTVVSLKYVVRDIVIIFPERLKLQCPATLGLHMLLRALWKFLSSMFAGVFITCDLIKCAILSTFLRCCYCHVCAYPAAFRDSTALGKDCISLHLHVSYLLFCYRAFFEQPGA